jgi:hypothetical protein
MEDMNIYDIKRATKETAPYYFSKKTLAHFGQTMKSFQVRKMESGRYIVEAPSYDREGKFMGYSLRIFDPETNDLIFPDKVKWYSGGKVAPLTKSIDKQRSAIQLLEMNADHALRLIPFKAKIKLIKEIRQDLESE